MPVREFQPGTILSLEDKTPIEIIEKLGEGGQGTVYRVMINQKEYALKWYHPKTPDAFYKNLVKNIKKGAPNPAFLWPEFITQKANDSFGYVMKLRNIVISENSCSIRPTLNRSPVSFRLHSISAMDSGIFIAPATPIRI